MTDNQQQLKKNKTYADAVVSITDNLELCYEAISDNDTGPKLKKI